MKAHEIAASMITGARATIHKPMQGGYEQVYDYAGAGSGGATRQFRHDSGVVGLAFSLGETVLGRKCATHKHPNGVRVFEGTNTCFLAMLLLSGHVLYVEAPEITMEDVDALTQALRGL
jgi:hypothetical protein